MDLALALRSHDLFAGLDDATLQALEADVRIVEVAGNQLVYQQGAAACGLYCVLQGRLRSFGEGLAIAEIGVGGYSGERALLTGTPHLTSLRAARDSTLLHVSAAGFQRLSHHAAVGMRLARGLARGADRPAGPLCPPDLRTIAVLALGAGAGLDRFIDDLVAAFAQVGSATACRAASLPASLMTGAGARDSDLAGYLAQVEQAHDLVVYVCAPDRSSWTQCALRQADVILVVAASDEAPQALDASLLPAGIPLDLVLLRAAEGLPQGTAAWRERGAYRQHHHALSGRKGDAARIARLLGGWATGLALSGGSRRATAYIGVFKALAACDIPLDVVAGTSGGAMLGAMYAQGWRTETMLEQLGVLDRAPFYRGLGPPVISLLGGKAINQVLRGCFGTSRLEDTPIRLMPVCTSLMHSRIVVPAEGALWRAVQASCAVPGIFPPVPWDGDLLVDGGIINNLPADLLVPSCAKGRLLAADVELPTPFAQAPADLHEANGWRDLWRHWTATARAPSLFEILQHAGSLASNARRQQTLQLVHLHLQPLASDQAATKSGLAALVEAGYRETMIALERASG